MKPFWHIHHEVLLEWSDDIQERIDYIKAHKPPHEVETRLRLLKPVQGALPPKHVKAKAAYDKARDAYDKPNAPSNNAYDECPPQIEALHALEFPNCPWNGTTIFPETTL